MRVLIPEVDSVNSLPAVRHVVGRFLGGERFEVHLLYLRSPAALQPARALLERFHIPYRVHQEHQEAGDKVRTIRAVARRLKADSIVMGTARPWSATRWSEDAVVERLLSNAPAPVTLVAGKSVSRLERYGVAAGLGAALGLILFS